LFLRKLREDTHIYVTRGYSIENDVVNRLVFKRILTELLGFSGLSHDELERVGHVFEAELDRFCRCLIPIMAWIVSWKRNGRKPSVNNILMRDLFAFSGASFSETASPKGKADVVVYIHSQSNLSVDLTADIAPIAKMLSTNGRYRLFARGKYLLWFLIEFSHSVHKDFANVFPTFAGVPKSHVTLSSSSGMAIVAPRARMPAALKQFVSASFLSYIGRIDRLPTA